MKNPRILTGLLVLFPLWLCSQTFQFSVPNTHFVLIPGGGFETKAWVDVPFGDTVYLTAEAGPGIVAFFQPAKVIHNQMVYLVVISTDSSLVQLQSLRLIARHSNDSIVHFLTVENHNNGHGFYLIDSARYYQDTVFQYLMQVYDASGGLLDSLRQLDWIPCYPYPPLLVVTHHMFVNNDWRNTVLWHNMIPPHNWAKVFLYNEVEGICFGVMIDTWGSYSTIPCEIMHYNYQDTITAIPDDEDPAGFSIYPNPAQGSVNIRKENRAMISLDMTLFSVTGQSILHEFWPFHESCKTLDLGSVPAGVYFLTISDDHQRWQKKIIKH